ncbi:prepilin peptidase [Gracilibacillus xinjiangensis]|uniref:Prepilin peptidase n=1 Tax=Gracilibacillus xinjiangensis TaxID=1193282 RepID=A0ABV8WXG1_9BACI
MDIIYSVCIFMIGLVFGSFFNVVGIRIPERTFFSLNRSKCLHCHHSLSWKELIPLLSFSIQKGKCKHCTQKISPIYPIVELISGIGFLFSYHVLGHSEALLTALLLISLFSIIMMTDWKYMIIPNKILLFFLPLFTISILLDTPDHLHLNLFGAAFGYGVIAVIILASSGGMGAGDMKLLGLLGFVVGFPKVLSVLLLAAVFGLITAFMLLILGKTMKSTPIPFGPSLALAAYIIFIYGDSWFYPFYYW